MNNRKISVAIATYNGEKFLPQLLESISAQTLLPDEVIFSDDNSTDSTIEVILQFKKNTDIKTSILRGSAQLGVTENFIRAFAACSGDYIAYCDQDDYWEPTKIEKYADIVLKADYSLVYHRSRIANEVLAPTELSMPNNVKGGVYAFPHFPDHIWGYGHQMLFSARILPMIERMMGHANDGTLFLWNSFDRVIVIAAGMSGDIFFIDEDLMLFRRHGGSLTVAGKEAGFSSKTESSKAEFIVSDIEKYIEIVTKLFAYTDQFYGEENKDHDSNKTRYRLHIEKILVRLNQRLILYRGANMAKKLSAFHRLLLGGNYGDAHANKIPPKTMLRDALYMLAAIAK